MAGLQPADRERIKLSKTPTGVCAVRMSIHDGDYWRHVLLRDGVVLDRFASMPSYFTDDPGETERLRAK